MKYLVFDSGSLITLALNGLLDVLRKLKKEFDGKFLITKDIKYECIDKPLTIKKYELGALQIRELLYEGTIELPNKKLNIETDKKVKEILKIANHTFSSEKQWIKLIDKGEASCLALSSILNKNKVKNMIVIDERTTRMLVEKPENLQKLLEKKLHMGIKARKENYKIFKNHIIIRSSELAFLAYKKKLIALHNGKDLLDALLYSIKFKGCAISKGEIKEMKKM